MSDGRRKPNHERVLEFGAPLGMLNASYAVFQTLKVEMSDETRPNGDEGISGEVFRERQRFSRFGARDAAHLAALRPVFERHSEKIVEQFYAHLMQFEPLRPLLSDPDSVERLKGFQREYLLSLASGRYDEQYARRRMAIGKIHDRVGLEPQWYLGTYGLYLDLLCPLIRDEYVDDPRGGFEAGAALAKLMVLDMQLVLDAYYGLREKKAVEKSEQLAAVGELAASIAHEVRNPLAGMKGALQVLRKELSVKPSNLEIVDELVAQIDRLESLVRDLLSFARPHTVEPRMLDLQQLLDRLLHRYQPDMERQGVTVQRIYEPGSSSVCADPRQLEQVFLNLVFNALQAMEQGGTLTVVTRSGPGGAVIEFGDTGKGIPVTDLPKIRQPFFTTKHRGSGLGLSIVQKIIDAHHGTVRVESVVGRGTRVTVELPSGH